MSEEIMERVGAAVTLGREGDPAAARELLAELWDEADDPVQRCAIAHYAADVQESVAEELAWDLRALAVVPEQPDARFTGFLPSLHLNLTDAYRRLGDLDAARRHLAFATEHAPVLPDDDYGRMIRGGIDNQRGLLT
ncbi:hypothetical protein Val02_06910 [Virgisporangium aliadipatigenens]|uniref:Tetratricopeptide repeat protein n=1 Tax=Virgisporangium aliadipatigenens TaxID=741659 RepID=A0A8J3YGV5_9ACTN|nr:hypothetical protein [Virgisporangium aliadipatigenens]GIJ43805.1 hypothetical protein Val02_06910 [Virgisporangium aliadipatigenens]